MFAVRRLYVTIEKELNVFFNGYKSKQIKKKLLNNQKYFFVKNDLAFMFDVEEMLFNLF
jgi:hypothetical protein